MGLVGNPSADGTGRRVAAGPVPARLMKDLTEVFRSLADRSRLQILFLLAEHGEMNVTAIGEEIGQSQPAVSHHLNQLKKAGLIDYRRDGKFNFYRLDHEGLEPLVNELFPDPKADTMLTFGGVEVRFKRK
ncbi:MAG: metalloregulator ArsR/SmtB family transcription factor [Gemmataceae bacterium]|nr:metalloregulator ArsR/SmtB family transcription factor [Gemmataceae bacterium]